MSSWVKVGIIGGVVVTALNLLGQLPLVGCFTWILALATYCCIVALVARGMPPVRKSGPAAGRGALAALVAGAIGTGAGAVFMTIRTIVFGPAPLPEGAPAELQAMSGMGGAVLLSIVLFVVSLVIAPVLGALSGLVYAIVKSE